MVARVLNLEGRMHMQLVICDEDGRPVRADEILSPRATAEFLGVSESMLAKMRCLGSGPPCLKNGGRLRGYPVYGIAIWVNRRPWTRKRAA